MTQAIEEGALVDVEAWEGNESVLDETFGLCGDLEWISDDECTPKEGAFSVSKEIVIEDDLLPNVSQHYFSRHGTRVHCKTIADDGFLL